MNTPKNIKEMYTIVESLVRKDEKCRCLWHNAIEVTELKDGKEYFVRPFNEPEKFLCWILERLPEWKDVEKFLEFHEIPFETINGNGLDIPDRVRYYLPLDWFTSPSILPTKIGEYLRRDER